MRAAAQGLNVGGAFTSLDRHYHNPGPNTVLADRVFSRLVRSGPAFDPRPVLATAGSAISPTEWEFRLHDGVTFAVGTPFTADDVVFTFGPHPNRAE